MPVVAAPRKQAKSQTRKQTKLDELKFEQGAFGERTPISVTQSELLVCVAETQPVKPKPPLEIVIFGKIHYVTREEFHEQAPKYLEMLHKELLVLQDALTSSKTIYREWANPEIDGLPGLVDWLVAKQVQGYSALKTIYTKDYERGIMPPIEEYDELIVRLEKLAKKFTEPQPVLTYRNILDIGSQFALIREDHKDLEKRIGKYREGAITTAEQTTKALEITESASFQVLNLVPTITLMDPLREAAYKIGLVVMRASARSLGAALARTSIARELCGVLKADVPGLVVDLVTLPLSKMPAFRAKGTIFKESILFAIQQVVEATCDVMILVSEKGTNIAQEDLERLLMNRLTSAIAKIASLFLGGRPLDSATKKWIKSLVESTVNTLWRDYQTAKDTARNEKRDVWEVFMADIGWTIVKIIQGTLVGAVQRNVHAGADYAVRDGVTEDKGEAFVREQAASAIFNGKFKVPPKLVAKNDIPLERMSFEEYKSWHAKTNLHPDLAGPLRRYAHDQNEIVAVRMPSKLMADHASEFPKRPKPGFIKTKSAKQGTNAGLVVLQKLPQEPGSPPSGKGINIQRYQEQEQQVREYQKEVKRLKDHGCLVREDGLVFHPDMLADWGKVHPSDMTTAQRAKQILEEASKAGQFDLSQRATQQWLIEHYPSDVKTLQGFLNRARVGYYSDLDLAEVVDAETGDRKVMGSGGESGRELAYARRNQDNMDKRINVNSDLENIPPEFLGPDKSPRVSGSTETPHQQALIQHGSHYEWDQYPGGPIVVILPGGQYEVIKSRLSVPQTNEHIQAHEQDIRQQYEALLKNRLGDKYKGQANRALEARKDALDDPTDWTAAGGKGERIRTEDVARRFFYYEQVESLEGRGKHPISRNDIAASLLHRGLDVFPVHPETFENIYAATSREQVGSALQEYNIVVAGDEDQRNLVLVAEGDKTIGDALARLGRLTQHLKLNQIAGLTLWYEIYTVFRPVTSDYVLSRIGGKDFGVTDQMNDIEGLVTSMDKPKDKRLCAFRCNGFAPTFTPDPKQCVLYQDVQVEGLKLVDVWENIATRRIDYDAPETPTQIAGRQVVVFTSGIATCPDSLNPFQVWGKPTRQVAVPIA